ncbi:MAG TPA: peptidoglycan-binding protein, partial [Clostridiales bacterium]|nr:peptidoglycan-binding protein [Clostridiales bacterium]
ETLKKLDSAYKNADSDKDDDSLRKGATGSAVKDLQTKLKKLGFYNASIDGDYGDTTVAAVKAFQKK